MLQQLQLPSLFQCYTRCKIHLNSRNCGWVSLITGLGNGLERWNGQWTFFKSLALPAIRETLLSSDRVERYERSYRYHKCAMVLSAANKNSIVHSIYIVITPAGRGSRNSQPKGIYNSKGCTCSCKQILELKQLVVFLLRHKALEDLLQEGRGPQFRERFSTPSLENPPIRRYTLT